MSGKSSMCRLRAAENRIRPPVVLSPIHEKPSRRIIQLMATIHISEAEAARNFAAVMDRVRAGAEVVIGNEDSPVAILRSALEPRGRLLSESIALAEKHAQELGYEPVMDAGFASDLEEIIRNRKPREFSRWD